MRGGILQNYICGEPETLNHILWNAEVMRDTGKHCTRSCRRKLCKYLNGLIIEDLEPNEKN